MATGGARGGAAFDERVMEVPDPLEPPRPRRPEGTPCGGVTGR